MKQIFYILIILALGFGIYGLFYRKCSGPLQFDSQSGQVVPTSPQYQVRDGALYDCRTFFEKLKVGGSVLIKNAKPNTTDLNN